jgi:hypothetical protein
MPSLLMNVILENWKMLIEKRDNLVRDHYWILLVLNMIPIGEDDPYRVSEPLSMRMISPTSSAVSEQPRSCLRSSLGAVIRAEGHMSANKWKMVPASHI